MWTLIKETNFDNFIESYPGLKQYKEEIQLHKGNGLIFLPRHFYRNYPHPDLIWHQDPNFSAKDLGGIKFVGELRDIQPGIVAPFISSILKGSSCGVLKARPGAGKTVMAINISCETNSKTLITIDNTNLAEQWMNSILEFTTAKYEDIGWIKGDDFNIDTPFVIAMVQTLVSRVKKDVLNYYKFITEAGFNIAFMDECHRSALGPQFAKSSLLLNTPSIIGLSATPWPDGLQEVLMHNIIGPILSNTKEYDLRPRVILMKYDSGLTDKYGRSVLMLQDMIRRRSRYTKVLLNSERYFQLLFYINNKLLTEGHRIINIVQTVDQVQNISHFFGSNGLANIQFYSKQRKVDKSNDKLLIATYNYAGAGFDYKELSGCVIATPLSGRKSLIQTIGRVLRSSKEKLSPVVYILIDTGFHGIFVSEMSRIKNIISEEFDCIIEEATWNGQLI